MPEKILIVDDDIDSLRLIRLMLQRQGYDIVTASAGNQGIAKAAEEHPNLIILDIMMPDMDGYEVCRRLRANPDTQNIPIIMFTAKALIDDKVAGFDAGADDYLTKPTHPAELAARVKTILQRNAQQHQPQSENHLTIGVIGAKGGIGVTTLTLNIAAAYRAMGETPVVADFRLGIGGLGLFMGIRQSEGMAHLMRKPAAEIPEAIGREIVTHTTGLRALLSSTYPKEALLPVPAESALAIIRSLRAVGSPTILDLGSGYSAFIHRIHSELNKIVVLIEPTNVNLSMAADLLRELAQNGKDRIKVVIVSHHNLQPHPPWQEIEHTLGHEICAIISAAPELTSEAIEAGIPLVAYRPNAMISSQISKLAADIHATAKS